ncbi:MAG: FbpB family small basic protein [Sporolactobacillus sp.]
MKKHLSYKQLLKKSREQIWNDKKTMDEIDKKIDQRYSGKVLKPRFA